MPLGREEHADVRRTVWSVGMRVSIFPVKLGAKACAGRVGTMGYVSGERGN